jgi:hypothetical protein
MPLDSNSKVGDIENATDGEGNLVPVANDGTYSTTVDGAAIDSTGVLMSLDTRGKRVLDLSVSGAESADYALKASPDGETWFGPFETWSTVSTINATYRIGARYVKIEVVTAAGGGATADGFMEVS